MQNIKMFFCIFLENLQILQNYLLDTHVPLFFIPKAQTH